jgi:hypothetical protein
MSCKKAIDIAEAMKEKFGAELELNILKNDSEKARDYTLLASTSVFVNDKFVPLSVALDKEAISNYLEKLQEVKSL